MSWSCYQIVFQAKSPIRIGFHKLGFIQRTRPYIMGRNLWGAMTEVITKHLCLNKGNTAEAQDYEQVGTELMNKVIIPGYFFPALKIASPLIPRYTEKWIFYGEEEDRYSSAEFERLFIHAFGQTGIQIDTFTAEEATLHETEYLTFTVEGNRKVFFVGHLFIKKEGNYDGEKVDWERIKDLIKEIRLGGDRRYGFGQLSLKDECCKEVDNCFGFYFEGIRKPMLIKGKDKINSLPAHLEWEDNCTLTIKGDIEPLVGRQWESGDQTTRDRREGAGQKISDKPMFCWIPGSILEGEGQFEVGSFGIWRARS